MFIEFEYHYSSILSVYFNGAEMLQKNIIFDRVEGFFQTKTAQNGIIPLPDRMGKALLQQHRAKPLTLLTTQNVLEL